MKLLARQDPVLDQILFYEDVPLFEDELHDNGESILNVRIVSRHLKNNPSDLGRKLALKAETTCTYSESCPIHSSFSHDYSYVSTMSCSEYMMFGYITHLAPTR